MNFPPAPPRLPPSPPAERPVANLAEGQTGDSPGGWDALFGAGGGAWLAGGAALVFAAGVAATLGDLDFGMHLRIGEWVAAHGRVPMVEPFAWTRRGAPFYAYSWGADVAYYALARAGGAAALRVLQGALVLAGAGGAWAYARVAGLPRAGSALLALAHVVVVAACVPHLRPQGVLGVVVPLAWAAGARLGAGGAAPDGVRPNDASRGAARLWPYGVLLGAAAAAANTHLLAPLVAAALAPVVGRAAEDAPGRRRLALAAACVGAGLLCTPYAAEWGAVLRLNFAENALFRFPSPIAEHQPGAVAVLRPPQVVALVPIALLALPWLLGPNGAGATSRGARVERALCAGLWIAGALLFALALRGLLVWWLLALPLVARALARVPTPSGSGVGRLAWRTAAVGVPAAMLAGRAGESRRWRAFEDPMGRRVFPSEGAGAAFAAADSLDQRAPGATGRVLTTFDYGNALLWRLPRLSMSVDGRTIFPDSAAAYDGFRMARDSAAVPAVVGSAEVAVLPARHALGARLVRAGWRRLATAPVVDPGGAADTAVVWVTDRWAARWVRGLPP